MQKLKFRKRKADIRRDLHYLTRIDSVACQKIKLVTISEIRVKGLVPVARPAPGNRISTPVPPVAGSLPPPGIENNPRQARPLVIQPPAATPPVAAASNARPPCHFPLGFFPARQVWRACPAFSSCAYCSGVGCIGEPMRFHAS